MNIVNRDLYRNTKETVGGISNMNCKEIRSGIIGGIQRKK